ncbi:hypothetical protein [Kutzneria buriramensis]|uniref:Uncharacterized protein n=1 Tax=Kutzneria buriramensis TaxID=1045776 RepID=A0A3E0HD88_9PSEU|nr:hypothetical protein [Kutzneria buriramensis]REH42753.1 hypothetical protein BCF44_110252 [Kutzneria buriramensis]
MGQHQPTDRAPTVGYSRSVLFVVNTVTSANRLLDIVPLFEADLRVYAAALDKPVVLAAFDEHEIVNGTSVSTMAELAGRLDRHAPLLPHLAAANAKCPA